MLEAFDSEDIQPGAVGFIQTAGELLRYHPHIHVLLTDGAWLPDGSFRHLLYFDTEHVQRLFRAEVFRLLLTRGKISQETVDAMLQWPHSGFSVHGAVRVETREEAARLGRYMIRCPIVLKRLRWDEERQEVVYKASRRRSSSEDVVASDVTVTVDESSCEEAPCAAERRRLRRQWARMLRRIFEVDPLLCDCGSRMRILSFITSPAVITKILTHLGSKPRNRGRDPPGSGSSSEEPAS